MLTNNEKLDLFLELAKEINKRFKVEPILFGSLGLSLQVKESIAVNDIDILLPQEFMDSKWLEIKELMTELGFKLVDVKEHQFIKDEYDVAFADDNDLFDLSGVRPEDLKIKKNKRASYKLLNLEQYLNVYKFMLRDGYRQEKIGDADLKKIDLIKRNLGIL